MSKSLLERGLGTLPDHACGVDSNVNGPVLRAAPQD
jgi:hypothetical protein